MILNFPARSNDMKLNCEHTINNFSKDNAPIMRVSSPITMTIETKDCYSNMLRSPETRSNRVPSELINPATGPIYIEGAEPGDTLKVTIEKIDIEDFGVVSCGDDCGPLAKYLVGNHLEIVDIKDGFADFLGKYKIPLHKMIGVIGVAPSDEAKRTSYPGRHGGNMDTNMITEGTVLYLPVAVPGALLAMGDVHAVMGDGEVGGSGLEIPANITFTIEVIPGKSYEFPIAEDDSTFCIIATEPTLDAATESVTGAALTFMRERIDLEDYKIIMLMSLVGDLQFSQVVDPEMTVRFMVPKKYLDRKEF